MKMLPRPAVNLCVTIIPVHIREHSAFPAFQVRTDAFRNSAQLFASTFFRYPGLSVFDPCIEVKMWIPRFHWFVSFSIGSHLRAQGICWDRRVAGAWKVHHSGKKP